jgi:hypothetical protein
LGSGWRDPTLKIVTPERFNRGSVRIPLDSRYKHAGMTDSSENWGEGVEEHTPFSSSGGERKLMSHFVVRNIFHQVLRHDEKWSKEFE